MILLMLFAVATALFALAAWFDSDELVNLIVGIFATLAAILALAFSLVAICTNINTAGRLAAEQARYESLVFQLENNFYDNENDIGKADLMAQIQAWNEDLALGKAADANIWIDILYPEIYEDLDFIELKGE